MTSALDPAVGFAYSPRVRELFADLRHACVLSDVGATHASPSGVSNVKGDACVAPTVVTAEVGSYEQGASVCLQMALGDGRVRAVCYRAYGCPYFLAGCELLARWLEGKSVAALHDWRWRDLEAELHAPPGKRSHWLLLEDAVQQMANKLM